MMNMIIKLAGARQESGGDIHCDSNNKPGSDVGVGHVGLGNVRIE